MLAVSNPCILAGESPLAPLVTEREGDVDEISKDELLEIIRAVVERVERPERERRVDACIFSDAPCDGGSWYAIGDE